MDFDVEAFVDGYVEAALWADCRPGEDDPEGETGGCENLTVPLDVREVMAADCRDFAEHHMEDLLDYCAMTSVFADDGDSRPEAYAGHDFWLTRCGHGAGFWDRGFGALGERLSQAARDYGSPDDHTPYDRGDGTVGI